MKTNGVIFNKVVLRAEEIKEKNKYNTLKRYCICSTVLLISLFTSIFKIAEIEMPHHLEMQLSYGTTINAYDELSVYVTVGVLMFALGSAFTIICIKLKNKGG